MSLPSLCDDQGRQVPAASNFELHHNLIFLDLDSVGIFSSGCEEKVLDVRNFSRHHHKASRRVAGTEAVRREDRKERDSCLPAVNPLLRGNWASLRIILNITMCYNPVLLLLWMPRSPIFGQ